MIGIVWQLAGDLVLSAQLVSCLAGILLVIPVFILADSLFGRRTGILSALMIALFPIMVYGSSECFSESIYTLLLISGLAAARLAFKSGCLRYPIFSGIFFLTL
jgi:4-amino-4-deoxy-L-arabinose transferase-like glycosyltransferase